MPSTYAHRRFGADVLQQLPAALQDQIGKNRALFDVGLHGPDLLFYYHAAKSNPVSALGNAMHEQPGRARSKNTRPGCSCMALPRALTGLDLAA